MTALSKFIDSTAISPYAAGSTAWTVENGIFIGTSANTIAPMTI